MMVQGDPEFGPVETEKELFSNLLGLEATELADLPIRVVATAIPKLVIPIASLAALRKVRPDLKGISRYCERNIAKGFSLLTTETTGEGEDLCTRYFNPLVGIDEDPATGVAAGPLGCYADRHIFRGKKKQLVIRQGFDMGMSSTIYVDSTNEVLVGGYAVSFGETGISI